MYKLYAIKYINHERGNSICVSIKQAKAIQSAKCK